MPHKGAVPMKRKLMFSSLFFIIFYLCLSVGLQARLGAPVYQRLKFNWVQAVSFPSTSTDVGNVVVMKANEHIVQPTNFFDLAGQITSAAENRTEKVYRRLQSQDMLHECSVTVNAFLCWFLTVTDSWFEETYFLAVTQQMLPQTSANRGFPAAAL